MSPIHIPPNCKFLFYKYKSLTWEIEWEFPNGRTVQEVTQDDTRPWGMVALRCRPYIQKKKKKNWEVAMDTIPLQSCGYFWALPAISSVAVTGDKQRLVPASPRSEGQLEAMAGLELAVTLLSLLGNMQLVLGTCSGKSMQLSFLVPFSHVLPPATLWHHTQRSWLAGSIVPYNEMSPGLVQTSPHCWWPSWLGVLLGSGLCWRPE